MDSRCLAGVGISSSSKWSITSRHSSFTVIQASRRYPFHRLSSATSQHRLQAANNTPSSLIISLEEVSNLISISNPSAETELLEAEAQLKRHEDFITLHENISKLPVKYQEAITLRFFENKQIKEISEILGKREGTVKSLLHRGLENLRKLME
ncbi:sigma-70 family RNA polymerase sigma factor [Dehalococcoidia bacterium]|nr:sigma-70 family RNA polymerase sigma factor [Dehalococcoidia bacterium]